MTVNRPIHVTPGSLFFTPEDIPIYVNRVPESFHLQEHTHDFVEISIVAEGDGEHYIDGTHFKVSKGDLFLHPGWRFSCIPTAIRLTRAALDRL